MAISEEGKKQIAKWGAKVAAKSSIGAGDYSNIQLLGNIGAALGLGARSLAKDEESEASPLLTPGAAGAEWIYNYFKDKDIDWGKFREELSQSGGLGGLLGYGMEWGNKLTQPQSVGNFGSYRSKTGGY